MSKAVKPIPEGYHSVIPHLVVKNGAAAIEFYKKVFGAEAVTCMPGPGGKVMHAEIKIGDSHLFLADEFPDMGRCAPAPTGGSPVVIHLYVADVDATFKRAVQHGATAKMEPADMFWGDRYGKVTDPFGHSWSIATHIEDVTPEEMQTRMQAMFNQMAKAG